MSFEEEVVSTEELANEAVTSEAPEKKARKAKGEKVAKAPREPKPPREKKERAPKIEWKPVDGPYPLTRGKLMTAKINVLNTNHTFKGKMGAFMDTILASETALEAIGVPAMVKKGDEEVAEFMDPGYVTFAARSGLIELV